MVRNMSHAEIRTEIQHCGRAGRHMMLRQTESLFIADEARERENKHMTCSSIPARRAVECECHLNLETRSCRHIGWCHFWSSSSPREPWAGRALSSRFRSRCSKGATRGISCAGLLQTQPLNSSQSTPLRVWKRPAVCICEDQ